MTWWDQQGADSYGFLGQGGGATTGAPGADNVGSTGTNLVPSFTQNQTPSSGDVDRPVVSTNHGPTIQDQLAQDRDWSYDWSKGLGNAQGIQGLDSNAFNWDAANSVWRPNMDNGFVNTAMQTAGYGSINSGLGAFFDGGGDNEVSRKRIAGLFGIDTNSQDWQNQLTAATKDFVSLKGMAGLNPNDPRQINNTLYKLSDGKWNPISSDFYHQREKGSWWEEGGSMIMVPLSIVAGGLASGLGAGGAAAGGGGITGTAGASGAAAYGSTGLTSALSGGGLGAGVGGAASSIGSTLGTAAGGATGLAGTIANQLGVGGQFSSLPSWAQSALNGAVQGAGNSALNGQNPLQGALTGGVTGGVMPGLNETIGGLGLGSTISGGLSGAAQGGLSSLLQGNNPLAGALVGGAGGTVGGGIKDLGGSSQLANLGSKYTSQLTGGMLNNAIQNEVTQGRQDVVNNLYAEAERRGISRQQLEQFMQTPQGRQALQAIMAQQGKGSLQSLFG